MPLTGSSRVLLTVALAHLFAATLLLLVGTLVGSVSAVWNPALWLLLFGFVLCTTLGFSLHLFPSIARRILPGRGIDLVPALTLEASLVIGAVTLYSPGFLAPFAVLFPVAALLLGVSVGITLGRFLSALSRPVLPNAGPELRMGDAASIPLFLSSWIAALSASVLFFLSGLFTGPGFGWWLAGVHVFVLGHATLLVAAVSLRMVPRSLGVDPPRALVLAIGASGIAGAILIPTGMLNPSWLGPQTLAVLAAPEGLFALLLVGTLSLLGARARTPRPQLALHLAGVLALVVGGGLGLWMVSSGNYAVLETHAAINVLGFLGMTILVMWFGMIAPFQRVSHTWTRRMLWTLSTLWMASVALIAAGWSGSPRLPSWIPSLGWLLLLVVVGAWIVGTLPVLYPRLNPLPGLTVEWIREHQGRWSGREGSRNL